MMRTHAWRSAEPVPPLSENARDAAAQSHDYALEHGLVLALLTEEHLAYHNSVAADEYARIPYAERRLDESHLPPLEIPPVSITEAWTVHQRVALALEAACRWLPDAELRACEEAVADSRDPLPLDHRPLAQRLKLDPPLLFSDHDEDCAELRRTVAMYEDRAGTRLRNQQQSSDVERALFAIPDADRRYAETMESELRHETIAVDEQTIGWLMAHLGSMEWTEADGDESDEEVPQLAMPCRRLPTPLPPVLTIDEYVPDGDVCLVSDASDVSSSMSEYVCKAVDAIPQKSTADFIAADEPAMASLFGPASDTNFSCSPIGELSHLDLVPMHSLEDSMSMFPLSIGEKHSSPSSTEDDLLFSDWIDESIYAQDPEPMLGEEEPAHDPDDVPVYVPQDDRSQSSAQEEGFETVTVDSLFAMEEDESVKQAKIPVVDLNPQRALPEWNGAAADPMKLFRWMMKNDPSAFACEGRRDDNEAPATKGDQIQAEEWIHDERVMESHTSWMSRDEHYMESHLFAPAASEMDSFNLQCHKELSQLLDIPRTDERPDAKVPKLKHDDMPPRRLKLSSPPQKETPGDASSPSPEHPKDQESESSWGSLMARFKGRKAGPANMTDENRQPSTRGTLQIKAPELLIGSRAFADSRPPSKAAHGGDYITAHDNEPALMDEEDSHADTEPMTVCEDLPKVILSTAAPRAVRSRLLTLLPGLRFIERDYKQYVSVSGDIDADDEADIVTSPCSGVILTTMVGLRQMDDQSRPLFQSRLARIASKYDTLHVFAYRHNARPASRRSGAGPDDVPELSPSDAMAFAQLVGFAAGLACDVRVAYVSGGEMAAAQRTARLLNRARTDKDAAAEKHLAEEATERELFLRQAGLNVYDAQIAIGVLGHCRAQEADVVRWFVDTSPEERACLLEQNIGSRRALAGVSRLFGMGISR